MCIGAVRVGDSTGGRWGRRVPLTEGLVCCSAAAGAQRAGGVGGDGARAGRGGAAAPAAARHEGARREGARHPHLGSNSCTYLLFCSYPHYLLSDERIAPISITDLALS